MRFAYIDSNGNEVPIPSVDALALRIELGAINEDTQLYDAQADQWGPAHTHEIFHTLSRDAEGDAGGFVAPPPPVPAPAEEEPPEDEARVDDEPADAVDDGPMAGLTLADSPRARPIDEEPSTASEEPPTFDFGDVTGGLEMESTPAPGPPSAETEPAMDFSTGPGDFGADLEQPMEFDAGLTGSDDAGSGGLDLERPMSEFQPEDPPAWMEPADGGAGEDVMDFSSVSSDAPTEKADIAPAPVRPPKPTKQKPSRPRFKKQRPLFGPIVGAVLLAVVAVGGYVAWPLISDRFVSDEEETGPQVVLPPLPEELSEPYRAAAGATFVELIGEARASVDGTIASPPRDWLAGVYLANASRYEDVETFWLGIQDELDAVRDMAQGAFLEAFESNLASAGIADDSRDAVMARARVGFEVSARDRAETLGAVEELVEAAVGLHEFLLANEEAIQHTPASTITADPVLEAQGSTPAVNTALRRRIGEVTGALDQLDYLDLVTQEGLWAAVARRLRDVGIR